ncbi:RHS Repeat, partial [Pseudovibrio denitrificans]
MLSLAVNLSKSRAVLTPFVAASLFVSSIVQPTVLHGSESLLGYHHSQSRLENSTAGGTGFFQKQIPIEAPSFKGLEPRLSFSYSSAASRSSGPNNVLGAGWHLGGLSQITRRAKRNGLPRFDEADEFLLDGQRLITCSENTKKAGCAAGGTHTAWIENYQKIKKGDKEWIVTSHDGTVLTYKPLSEWATYDSNNSIQKKLAEQYRWLLATVKNTLGKTVTYRYDCTNFPTCQVQKISYDSGAVEFNWVTRPDIMTYATGLSLGNITQRLQSVVVKSAGKTLRAYKLSYELSSTTKKSLITSIQEFGRDVTLNNGAVSGGSSISASTFSYSQVSKTLKTASHNRYNIGRGSGFIPLSQNVNSFTYNNDMQLDGVSTSYSVTGGFFGGPVSYRCYFDFFGSPSITSFNSDTKDCLSASINVFIARQSYSDEKKIFVSRKKRNGSQSLDPVTYSSRIGDFDGDGLEDIIGNSGSVKGVFTRSTVDDWSGDSTEYLVGDFNSDGLADLYKATDSNISIKRSNGVDSFISLISQTGSFGSKQITGDLNGDGINDFLSYEGGSNFKAHYVAGNTLVSSDIFALEGYSERQKPAFQVAGLEGDGLQIADLDGDGRGDIVAHYWKKNSSSSYIQIYLNEGNETFKLLSENDAHSVSGSAAAFVGDLDRDGIAEIIERENGEKNIFGDARYYVTDTLPDVMISATDPSGVEQTISYSLYKGEADNWFPYPRRVVSSVTTNDGRGSLSTTHYSYSGGKWDYERSLFLGFEKIITTLPKLAGETNAPTIETTYRQDVSSVGKIAQQIWKDGDGTILRKQVQEYAVQNDNEPYTSLNTASLTYSYDEGVERVQKTTRIFDAYGQVKHSTDHGDTAKSGDERTYTRWSYPNKDKYIINKWAVESINTGTSYHYTDRRVWRRWHYYDDQSITTPPTKGLKTWLSQWDGGDKEDKLALSRNSYDSHGNLLEQRNALGETISYVYDPQYNLFPEQERSPLFHAGDARHV